MDDMEAKELMIGDWIDVHEDGKHLINAQYKTDFRSGLIYYPIPLTPKILEKNGFKLCNTYEWKDNMFVEEWKYLSKEKFVSFKVHYTKDYDGYTWHNCDVNSVHKLQHALRLCGLNKLADNIKLN